jgi:hypothetical protein
MFVVECSLLGFKLIPPLCYQLIFSAVFEKNHVRGPLEGRNCPAGKPFHVSYNLLRLSLASCPNSVIQ